MKSRFVPFLEVVTPELAVFLVIYALVLRPWHQRWGATDAEVRAALPGDDLIAAKSQITHAITINAPPEKVWPWLMQIGQDRSGFYSYTRLENMIGCAMPKVERLVPDRKPRTVGETVWFGTPKHFKGASVHGGRGGRAAEGVRHGRSAKLEEGSGWRARRRGELGVRAGAGGCKPLPADCPGAWRHPAHTVGAWRGNHLLGSGPFCHGAQDVADDQAAGGTEQLIAEAPGWD
jgi:hypothetical protein